MRQSRVRSLGLIRIFALPQNDGFTRGQSQNQKQNQSIPHSTAFRLSCDGAVRGTLAVRSPSEVVQAQDGPELLR